MSSEKGIRSFPSWIPNGKGVESSDLPGEWEIHLRLEGWLPSRWYLSNQRSLKSCRGRLDLLELLKRENRWQSWCGTGKPNRSAVIDWERRSGRRVDRDGGPSRSRADRVEFAFPEKEDLEEEVDCQAKTGNDSGMNFSPLFLYPRFLMVCQPFWKKKKICKPLKCIIFIIT